MVDHDFESDARMSLRRRTFWALVGAASTLLLFLTIVCALQRSPIGY